MKSCQFIAVDRENRTQATEEGIVLWIAPEGTRSKDGKLLPLKGGGFRLAIDTATTIIPVGFRGAPRDCWRKTGAFPFQRHTVEPIARAWYEYIEI